MGSNPSTCMNYKGSYTTDHLVPPSKFQNFNHKSINNKVCKEHFKILKVIGRGSFGKVFLV